MTTGALSTEIDETPEQHAARPTRRSRRSWFLKVRPIAAVLGGTAAIAAHAALYGYWIVDDAAITFAYARNVAQGFGPVLQPGVPPVEGFSNPTWMFLLALGRLLGLFDQGLLFGIPDYAVYPKALALACCAGILTACYLAVKRVTKYPSLVTLLSGFVLAAIPSFVIWSFSGLENALYALLAVCIAVLMFRAVLDDRLLATRVALLTGVIAAAAALTRPDGLVYAGAYPIVVLLVLRRSHVAASARRIALSVGAFAVPFGGYVCWRYVTFGKLVPNTAVAKSQDLPDLQNLNRVSELVSYAGAPTVLLLTAVVGVTIAKPNWWRGGLVGLLVPLELALLAFVVLNPDWMPQYRFATPVWAIGAILVSLTGVEVLRHARRRRKTLLAATLAVSLAASGVSFASAAQSFRESPTVPMCIVADRLGRNFNGYADILNLSHGSLLLPDLGGSALTSRLRLYDMVGLVSPKFAEFMRTGDMEALRDYVYEDIKPTFIHTHGHWSALTGIAADPRLNDAYYPIFQLPPNSPNGEWVRKDVVPNKQVLQELQAYAQRKAAPLEAKKDDWPLRHCGATLRPGQTKVGQH